MKLAAVTLASRNLQATAQAQAVYSQRVDVPTIDTLQGCGPSEMDEIRQYLVEKDIYKPDFSILCVKQQTYEDYKFWRTAEARTNCYGDAIGIADRINPVGVRLGDRHGCKSIINGALQHGAVRPTDGKCPDFTREMQFFVNSNRSDFHVVSRGEGDASWMNKFSGTPRFPVTIASVVPHLSGGITWIVSGTEGNFTIANAHAEDYAIRCPQVLCSLPEKNTASNPEL